MVGLYDLPKQAQMYISGITSDIERTKDLVDNSSNSESIWTLRQTLETYVPDAVKAYLALPISSRHTDKIGQHGETADDILLAQLEKLAWATRHAAQNIIVEKGRDLLSSQRFIDSKFANEQVEKNYTIISEPHHLKPSIPIDIKDDFVSNQNYISNDAYDFTSDFILKVFSAVLVLSIIGGSGTRLYQNIMNGTTQYAVTSEQQSADAELVSKEEDMIQRISTNEKNNVVKLRGSVEDLGYKYEKSESNKPAQYIYKKIPDITQDIIYDKQEHWVKNLTNLHQPDGKICNTSCTHLGFDNDHFIGFP